MRFLFLVTSIYFCTIPIVHALSREDEMRVRDLVREEISLDVDRAERNRALAIEARDSVNNILPIGSIIPFAGGGAVPAGFLECEGQAVAKLGVYADLYAVVGDYYTPSLTEGADVFYLPDLRGRGIVGAGVGKPSGTDKKIDKLSMENLADRKLGENFGTEVQPLTIEELPSHTHVATDSGHWHPITDPGHKHVYWTYSSTAAINNGGVQVSVLANGYEYESSTGFTGIKATEKSKAVIQVGSTGGGKGHNNMQPSLTLRYLIKYKGSNHGIGIPTI